LSPECPRPHPGGRAPTPHIPAAMALSPAHPCAPVQSPRRTGCVRASRRPCVATTTAPTHPNSDVSLLARSSPCGRCASVVVEPALPTRAALARVVLAAGDNGARSPGGGRPRSWLETSKPALSVGTASTHGRRRWSPPSRWQVTTAHAPGGGRTRPWLTTTELALHSSSPWARNTENRVPNRIY
jgi:hypothetical protein